MILVLLALAGLVVILQLRGISRQLERGRSAVDELRGEIQELRKTVDGELRRDKDDSLAHRLSELLHQISKDILQELSWYGDHTFANSLNERLTELQKAFESSAKDVTSELRAEIADISRTLDSIDEKTSQT